MRFAATMASINPSSASSGMAANTPARSLNAPFDNWARVSGISHVPPDGAIQRPGSAPTVHAVEHGGRFRLRAPISTPARVDITIQRQRPCASEAQRQQSGEIKEVRLIAGLPEMRAGPVVGEKLDGAESVGEMDGEDRDKKHHDHGARGERNKSSQKDKQSARHLNDNSRPAEEKREGHADRVQNANEHVRAASELGVAVLEKSVAHNQSKRQRE